MGPSHGAQRTRRDTLTLTLLNLLALLGGFLLPLLILWVLTHNHFPAYENSHFIRSLTTVAQVILCLIVLGCAAWAHAERRYAERHRTQLEQLNQLTNSQKQSHKNSRTSVWRTHFGPGFLASLSISALVTVSLGLPLSATKLYLHGISADQAFRTEYLTRLTDSTTLHDMAYQGMSPYYPSAWFWLGGRYANLVHLPGWEAFKPWAIISLALTASIITTLWCTIVRPDLGILIGTTTALVTTAYGSAEPYAAIVAMTLPLVFVLGWRALHPQPDTPANGWPDAAGAAILLGLGACTYTLFTALGALTLVLMAIALSIHRARQQRDKQRDMRSEQDSTRNTQRSVPSTQDNTSSAQRTRRSAWQPILRLLIMGAGALALSFIHWGHYLADGHGTTHSTSGSALHYLPEDSASLLLPMFTPDIVGLLSLIGLIWLVAAFRKRRMAQALSIGIIAMYLWELISMVDVAGGVTLLGFRINLPLILAFPLAGVCGIADGTRYTLTRIKQRGDNASTARTVHAVITVIVVLLGVGLAQNIPATLDSDIRLAYSDTDGYGTRANREPATDAAHYPQVNQALLDGATTRLGHPATAHDITILTTEEPLLAYYPYWSFQAISPHYANPLGLYEQRNHLIEDWAHATSTDDLLHKLNTSPYPAPNAFVFHRDGNTYTLLLSEDVYPNQPNVHDYTVAFPASLFQHHCFLVKNVGPFAVVTRLCHTTQH